MFKKILLSILFFGPVLLQAQKFSAFSADFSILEKNTKLDSSYLVVGMLEYDLYSNQSTYSISFPEKKYWVFKDSTLTVLDSLQEVIRIDTVGMFNEHFIFKKLLTNEFSDADLAENGFVIDDIIKKDDATLIKWTAPSYQEFISTAYSKKVDNQIRALIFSDFEGLDFNKTFFEQYTIVKDVAVPTKIKSHFITSEEQIFKEIQFRNVEIN